MRQIFDLAKPKRYVAALGGRRIPSSSFNHLWRHVYTDDAPLFPYLLGGEKTVESPAAVKVYDYFPRLKRSNGLGIAAT